MTPLSSSFWPMRHRSARRIEKSSRLSPSRKRKAGAPLSIDNEGAVDPLHGDFADRTIVAESLDVEQTSVGLKADLPQRGEVGQPAAGGEIARVVDGGLG